MKLLFHPACGDLLRAWGDHARRCRCGQTSIRYVTERDVEVTGDGAVVLAVGNGELEDTYRRWQADEGKRSKVLNLIILPQPCLMVRRRRTA